MRKLGMKMVWDNAMQNIMQRLQRACQQVVAFVAAARLKAELWWLKQSPAERLIMARRTIATTACALVAVYGLPHIADSYQQSRTVADVRLGAIAITSNDTTLEALAETRAVSDILEHSWLRTVEYSIEREPAAALLRSAAYERDVAAIDSTMKDRLVSFNESEGLSAQHKCLSQAVYYEAGYEKTAGKLAVAEVIMNRVADHRYPNSVCEVVFQGATRTTGCQFTFTCDGALRRKPGAEGWKKAEAIATHILLGLHEPRTQEATHYHANYVDPIWNAGLMRTTKIGAHIFYRFPRGAEWTKIRGAVERKREILATRRQIIASRERAARANAEARQDGYVTYTSSEQLKAIRTASTGAGVKKLNVVQRSHAPAP